MGSGDVFALFGILSFIIVMKVMICSCFLRRHRNRRDDTIPILEGAAERLQEIHQQRIRSRRAREPPPTFEDALRNSRPVSYIDVELPPPSYEEYLHSNSSSTPKDLEFPASVNPSDLVVIPLDVNCNYDNDFAVTDESHA